MEWRRVTLLYVFTFSYFKVNTDQKLLLQKMICDREDESQKSLTGATTSKYRSEKGLKLLMKTVNLWPKNCSPYQKKVTPSKKKSVKRATDFWCCCEMTVFHPIVIFCALWATIDSVLYSLTIAIPEHILLFVLMSAIVANTDIQKAFLWGNEYVLNTLVPL